MSQLRGRVVQWSLAVVGCERQISGALTLVWKQRERNERRQAFAAGPGKGSCQSDPGMTEKRSYSVPGFFRALPQTYANSEMGRSKCYLRVGEDEVGSTESREDGSGLGKVNRGQECGNEEGF